MVIDLRTRKKMPCIVFQNLFVVLVCKLCKTMSTFLFYWRERNKEPSCIPFPETASHFGMRTKWMTLFCINNIIHNLSPPFCGMSVFSPVVISRDGQGIRLSRICMVALNSMSMEYGIDPNRSKNNKTYVICTSVDTQTKDKMEMEIVGDYGEYVRFR